MPARAAPWTVRWLLFLAVASACAAAPRAPPEPYVAIDIRYGRIAEVEYVSRPTNVPQGALVGGFLGLVLGGHHAADRLVGLIAGAAIGGAVTAASEGPTETWAYTVALLDGGSMKVVTDTPDLRQGDCVAVEAGRFTNVRRVSGAWCEPAPRAMDRGEETRLGALERESAIQCHAAKEALLKARTRDEVDLAVRKVRVLCGT